MLYMSFVKFDFEEQRFRHYLELEEFKLREKLEVIPLETVMAQLNFEKYKSKEKIFWITVNPPPDYDVQSFIDKCCTLNPNTYKDCKYTIEQRGETIKELGKGVHLHMVCRQKKNQSKKNIINNFSSKFKLSNSCVDVKIYPESMYNDKVNYLKGIKDDPEKDKKIEMDKLFHEKYNLNIML